MLLGCLVGVWREHCIKYFKSWRSDCKRTSYFKRLGRRQNKQKRSWRDLFAPGNFKMRSYWKGFSSKGFTSLSVTFCHHIADRVLEKTCTTWFVIRRYWERSRKKTMSMKKKRLIFMEIRKAADQGEVALQVRLTLTRREVVPKHLQLRRQKRFIYDTKWK